MLIKLMAFIDVNVGINARTFIEWKQAGQSLQALIMWMWLML